MTVSSRLDTPIKRSFFLVLLIGALIQIINVAWFLLDGRGNLSDYFGLVVDLPTLFRHWGSEAYGGRRIVFWLSALLVAVGLSCSVYYDKTLGRLVNWIRLGKL